MDNIVVKINKRDFFKLLKFPKNVSLYFLVLSVSLLGAFTFYIFLANKLGLAYNDARSHLDIGRRVVEGLKPGLAQLGSVWLPLPHLLMIPTIWNDFMWHTGLSGALESIISYVATSLLIYLYLKKIGVGVLGRIVGVLVFALNMNILYLQSTAMTELLLLASMTAAVYYLLLWFVDERIIDLIKAAFFVMASTLVRYDGWFLLFYACFIIVLYMWKKRGYKVAEGTATLFLTLGGLGIILWFLWNQLIFKDALYFVFGPYSAHAQQEQLQKAGVLATKGNLLLSFKVYSLALIYNSGAIVTLLAILGAIMFWFDKKISQPIKIVTTTLLVPYGFNILALYLGHSVLFIQGISGNTWFNVRYGVMMMPSIAIFIGYLTSRVEKLRYVLVGVLMLVLAIAILNGDAVTIDDARVGSSQKNVTQVANWLNENAKDKKGFVLISAASHDAIIFSSGLPMKRFIHEGTGKYWESATTTPDRWARWIIMRTYDDGDQTWKTVSKVPGFKRYTKVESYPFADIYEIKPQYVKDLNTEPVFGKQK